jgi:hypothetical protein
MSLQQLPDELLFKIFRHLLNEPEIFASLRVTCKRFLTIINKQLLTVWDQQFPSPVCYTEDGLNIKSGGGGGGESSPSSACGKFMRIKSKRTCNNCEYVLRVINSRHVVYRHLRLGCTIRDCCVTTIVGNRRDLETIVEFSLMRGQVSPGALDTILRSLENICRLNVLSAGMRSYRISSAERTRFFTTSRKLVNVGLDAIVAHSSYVGELVLSNFPATQLFIDNSEPDYRPFERWLKRYLQRHHESVRVCRLDLVYYFADEYKLREILAEFDYEIIAEHRIHSARPILRHTMYAIKRNSATLAVPWVYHHDPDSKETTEVAQFRP